jgi:hypothetical protein
MNETTNLHTQTNIARTSWNPASGRFDYSFTFAFRTREQYLMFRRSWKENYVVLSQSIRTEKELVRATMRKREYAGGYQSKARQLRLEATLQLLMLKAAKYEANRQYLAAKQPTK